MSTSRVTSLPAVVFLTFNRSKSSTNPSPASSRNHIDQLLFNSNRSNANSTFTFKAAYTGHPQILWRNECIWLNNKVPIYQPWRPADAELLCYEVVDINSHAGIHPNRQSDCMSITVSRSGYLQRGPLSELRYIIFNSIWLDFEILPVNL